MKLVCKDHLDDLLYTGGITTQFWGHKLLFGLKGAVPGMAKSGK